MAGRACHVVVSATHVGLTQVLGPRNIGHESWFLPNCQPRIVGWSCPKFFAGGFGQFLERNNSYRRRSECSRFAMEACLFVIKWCARGLSGAHGSSGFVQSPHLQLQPCSPHPQFQVGGLSRKCGLVRRSSWCCETFAQQIIQAEPAS
jgi:hypothetical protein